MTDLERIEESVKRNADRIIQANDEIWEYAELAFHEYKSAGLLCRILREEGFEVEEGLAGIPTCFKGTFRAGSGTPVAGFLGEYDALAGLSQEAGAASKKEMVAGGPGHGCGHSALGTGSLAAALALKEYLEETGKDGTVVYFGCPAEEGAGSKQFMARAGLFDDVDFVYTWHPASRNEVDASHNNAIMGANFRFHGVTAHAGATPYLGRSALDAVELMSVGCNYLREHMIPEARIHYAYIDAGGTAPNVVQDRAVVRYEVRSPYVRQLKELFDRVVRVAQGAAMMTDTTMEYELAMAFTEYIPNHALAQIADQCMQEVGAPKWSEEDYRLAKAFLDTYEGQTRQMIREEIERVYGADRVEELMERPLDSEIHPYSREKVHQVAGSTDVGDVGCAVPTLNLNVATCCLGNVGHTWQMTAQTCSPLAHKGLLTAAVMMALCAVRTMEQPQVIEAAKEEVRKRNGGAYHCPLPDSVQPPLNTY